LQGINKYTEEELVQLLKNKSRTAFSYLYDNYAPVLNGIILKVIYDENTAKDVLQDVFVKIWNGIDQYDALKGRIYTWMINIARNAAIDKLRSKGEIMKAKVQTSENAIEKAGENLKTEQFTDAIGLRKLVSELKPDYRTLIDLAYFSGYTMDEISKTLEVPIGTVKTRMRSALKQLKEVYQH
jgi:RNA polymerase sigma-70 factor (ECF subfamily)